MTFETWWAAWKNAVGASEHEQHVARAAWESATKAERKACAELADEIAHGPYEMTGHEIGSAIRKRD